MARIPTNKAPKDIQVEGSGPRGKFVITDQTDAGTMLARLTVVDKDLLPEFRNNVLSVGDERFELRDDGLYLKEGVQLAAGKYSIELTATDATNPLLTRTEILKFTVTHVEPAASVAGDTLTLNYGGAAAITHNGDGGWHVVIGDYGMDLTPEQVAGIANVQLHGDNSLDVAGNAINGKALAVNGGAGDSLNVSGVTFTESAGGVSVNSNTDLSHLVANVDFLVNDSLADAFKAVWNYLDDAYAYLQNHYGNSLMFGYNGYTETELLPGGMLILGQAEIGAAALAVNKAVAELDLDYANYLHGGGSPDALTSFIAKTNAGGTREQTIHDNLLGAVSATGITDRNFPDDVENAFLARFPGDYGTRPYAAGNLDAYGHTDAGTNSAKAWDFARGVERSDYVTDFTGPIDVSATKGDGTMLFGSGNPATGYTIEVHDGSGVEFGWNVHYRTGDQITGHQGSDGFAHFDAPSGHQVAGTHNVSVEVTSKSAVSVDYALVTGLNGTSLEVTDYVVKLFVDLDATAGVVYKSFTLTNFGVGANFFVADDGSGGLGDTVTPPTVAEDSFNFGFPVLAQSITPNTGDLAAGTYDILAEVWDASGVVQLVGNHIVLDVV